MALINCPRCGIKISERAQQCPHCGCTKQEMEQIAEAARVQAKKELMTAWSKEGKLIVIGSAILLTVIILMLLIRNPTSRQDSTTHTYVDLGLPSGILWATCNVGATKPEEYGDYFAWGETKPKKVYDWITYKWGNGDDGNLTKYCVEDYEGVVDNKTTLEASDDAASVNWGDDWRMPTTEELYELYTECSWEYVCQNGVKGYKVISKKNGRSIFIPFAGYREGNSHQNDDGYYFWSNSNSDLSTCAWCMTEYLGEEHESGCLRCCGFPVRAVYEGVVYDSEEPTID